MLFLEIYKKKRKKWKWQHLARVTRTTSLQSLPCGDKERECVKWQYCPHNVFQPQAKTADTIIFMSRTITFISNQSPHLVWFDHFALHSSLFFFSTKVFFQMWFNFFWNSTIIVNSIIPYTFFFFSLFYSPWRT